MFCVTSRAQTVQFPLLGLDLECGDLSPRGGGCARCRLGGSRGAVPLLCPAARPLFGFPSFLGASVRIFHFVFPTFVWRPLKTLLASPVPLEAEAGPRGSWPMQGCTCSGRVQDRAHPRGKPGCRAGPTWVPGPPATTSPL